MDYISTRGAGEKAGAAMAIKKGIAPDGGLYLPEEIPFLDSAQLERMVKLDYVQRAATILSLYLTDFSVAELLTCAEKAYKNKFARTETAPLANPGPGLFFLELWHGPTCAFKDMALQIMPHFLTRAMQKTGEKKEVVILVATSGDTGKAALEGFRDVPQTSIHVFFPEEGVSELQKLQMITQEGNNVGVMAVKGNFDDAQNGVKEIFSDAGFNELLSRNGKVLSSANSINWGRLVPQIVYYISAYLDLAGRGHIKMGEEINIVVPTGNFGNILAAYYGKKMGLPVHKLICASNSNNVLTDFIESGAYNRNREFYKTSSPSMDILISSNLERLLFEIADKDSGKVAFWMKELKEKGEYKIEKDVHEKITDEFWGAYATEEETMAAIRDTYEQHHYLIDPHTAVGKHVYDKYVKATSDNRPVVIASTASPFKFNASVARAIFGPEAVRGKDEFTLLQELSEKTGLPIPESLRSLKDKPVRFGEACEKDKMKEMLEKKLLAK